MAKKGSEESAKEKQYQALELRKAGASYRQIGAQLGVSDVQCHRYVKAALAQIQKLSLESAEEYRALELEKLDNYELRINKQVQNGNFGAIDRALRIIDQRAKLLGLYDIKAGTTESKAVIIDRELDTLSAKATEIPE
jgi:hypothetical protein